MKSSCQCSVTAHLFSHVLQLCVCVHVSFCQYKLESSIHFLLDHQEEMSDENNDGISVKHNILSVCVSTRMCVYLCISACPLIR